MKNFYSILAVAALTINANAQETEQTRMMQYNFPPQGNNTNPVNGVFTHDDARTDYKWGNGGGNTPPRFYTTGSAIRLYSKNTITLSLVGKPNYEYAYISKVVLLGADGGTYLNANYSIDNGNTYQPATKVDSFNYEATLDTANKATDIIFQMDPTVTTGNSRIIGAMVTFVYKVDPGLSVGDTNLTKTALVKNTIIANDLIFAADSNVSIINMNGQTVMTADVKKDTKLNVSQLTKGVYLVTGSVNGKAVSQKVIKK